MASSSVGNLFRKLVGPTSRGAAAAALPGAGINFALGALSGNPAAGVAYAAGDFLLNYPLVGLARKIAPGTPGGMATIRTKTGQLIQKEIPHMPSQLESGVNFAASLASAPLVDIATQGKLYPQAQQVAQVEPTQQSQEQQLYQQALQRQQINQLEQQALAPGTQFQMQGIEQTAFHYPGITLPPDILALLQSNQANA